MAGVARDVVVVGGGPAGGAVAILLARFGLSCLLIERRPANAPRLCGEFLSPDSLPILRILSVEEEIRRLTPPLVRSVRVTAPHGICWEGQLPQPGMGISRFSLEEVILARAMSLGVEVIRGSHVRRASEREDGGWAIEVARPDGERTTMNARSVITSTGRERTTPGDGRARDRHIAYQAHFDGPSLQGRIELHGFRGGYAGLVDVENGRRNLCVLAKPSGDLEGAQPAVPGGAPNRPEAILSRIAASNPHFASWSDRATRVSEWTSTSVRSSRAASPVSENGILNIGDAAGAIAPFAGNGRAMALRSAELVAPIVHEHLAGRISLRHAGTIWRQAWQREFLGRTRVAGILNEILIHPVALAAFLRLLRTIPPIGALAISLTRGPIRDGSRVAE